MSSHQPTLVVATRNAGKIREIAHYLQDLPLRIVGLDSFPQIGEIEETGSTFLENARLKARAVHRVSGGYVLADDSGLVCDDLGGSPGIYSARFAGPKATDEQNNQKLLESLSFVHDPSRSARYVCALVLIKPDGSETVIEEACEGAITMMPSGQGGFGYDPYFFLPEKNATMAEISLEEKNKISHRGKALRQARSWLESSLSLPS